MKYKIFCLLAMAGFFNSLKAQSESPETTGEKIYEMFDLEKAPVFPGGETAMMEYLAKNVQYPALARENNIQGSVVLTFIVEKDGSVSNVQPIRDIGGGCGKESVRVVQAMPGWAPGEANGHPVKVRFTLPIRFKLDDVPVKSRAREESAPIDEEEMWRLVTWSAIVVYNPAPKILPSTPFSLMTADDKKLLTMQELAFNVKVSADDGKRFKTLGELSDYFYKAQFAPSLYTIFGFKGRQAKFLSSRADFDLNADGLGEIGSLKVPKGIRLVLYSKKNFKGKKLEINAEEGTIEIPDMAEVATEKGVINDGGKGVNWGVNTRSIKIILPEKFPAGL